MVLLTSKPNFEDTLNSVCSCSIEVKAKLHFFLRYQFFNDVREILMNDLMNIDRSLLSMSQRKLISVLLYGSDAFDSRFYFALYNSLKTHTDLTIAFYKSFLTF